MKKRLFLIFLTLCLMAAALPVTAFAANSYLINGVLVRYDDFPSRPGNCRAYAESMYEKIWDDTFGGNFYSSNNFLRGLEKEQLTLTEEHLKEYVGYAPLGATIRISSPVFLHRNDGNLGHSQIIVQKDEEGFTVLEGGLKDYPYHGENYYTWSEYVNTHWLGGKYGYIKYIKWPGAPEYYEGYGAGIPRVSTPVVNLAEDLTGFSISYTASDDLEVTEAFIRVWPQGQTEGMGTEYRCQWDGTTASAAVTCDVSGSVKNYYCKWYAVDNSGNVGGTDRSARLISLYTSDISCIGYCQVRTEDAPVCTAPYLEVNGQSTEMYRASRKTRLTVTGIHLNDEGQRWYLLNNGLWISDEHVRYDTFFSFVEWLYCQDPNKEILYQDKQILFIGE